MSYRGTGIGAIDALKSLAIAEVPLSVQRNAINRTLFSDAGHAGPFLAPDHSLAGIDVNRWWNIQHDDVFSNGMSDTERISDLQADMEGAVILERMGAGVFALRECAAVAK